MAGLKKLRSGSFEKRIEEACGMTRAQFEKALESRTLNKMLVFNLDVGCTQKCKHCFNQHSCTTDIGSAEQNLRKARKLGYETRVYATEPSANPKTIPLYAIAEDFYLITNGVKTEPLLDDIKKAGIRMLGISLHGPDAETHALMTGHPENFFSITETFRQARQMFYLQAKTTVHRKNMHRLEELVFFARDLGAQEIQIINLIKAGAAENLPDDYFLTPSDAEEIVRVLGKIKEKYATPRIAFAQSWGPNFYLRGVYSWLLGQAFKERPQSTRWCPAGNTYFALLNDDVYACPNSTAAPETRVGRWDVNQGILLSEHFWQGDIGDKLVGMCSPDNCEYNPICQGGCRAFAYSHTKDLYGSPPFCLTRMIEKLS
jgi:radical SAM protein with 4Fe4S-binding SPASM domain